MDSQTVEIYPYMKLNWYPHMMPEDVAVWERCIEQYPDRFDFCEYDYPVGKVPAFVANETVGEQATMERLYKKKIDVVAKTENGLWIIELKPACTMSTIGQVLGYVHLYVRDVSASPAPAAMVICGEAGEDVKEFALAQGVEIVVV